MRSEQEIQEAIDQLQADDLHGESILVNVLQWVLGHRDELEKPVYQADVVVVNQGRDMNRTTVGNGDMIELVDTPFAIRAEDIRLEEMESWNDLEDSFGN